MPKTETVVEPRPKHGARHQKSGRSSIPLLENGDRLMREEFERRYNAMPHLKKAELIEGRVSMSSAVRMSHSGAHAKIMAWLSAYWVYTPGIELHDNATVRMDEENEPQPDALLRIEADDLATSWVSEDDYLEGAPELIVEIAGSSVSHDLYEKFEVYQRRSVKEYLVWQLYENRLDWFVLQQGQYTSLTPDNDGIIRSRTFPGLFLAVEALLSGDMATVLAVLQQGLQTKEHVAFVAYLEKG